MPEVVNQSDEAGGTDITSYHLEWKQPTDVDFQDIIGGNSGDNLNRVISVSTTPGEEYSFRYRIRNVFGWSASYSGTVTILSATVPATPVAATTAIAGSFVRVSWVKPAENSSPIVSYDVKIKAKDGTMKNELGSCDGSDATIREARDCLIPLTTLIGAEFNLVQGDLVEVAILATNSIGSSAYSPLNTDGAMVETIPQAPASLTRNAATSFSQVSVDWVLL